MNDGHPGKFGRDEQRAFDVYVRVDEAGKNIRTSRSNRSNAIGVCCVYRGNSTDEPVFDEHFDRNDLLFDDINQVASDLHLFYQDLSTK